MKIRKRIIISILTIILVLGIILIGIKILHKEENKKETQVEYGIKDIYTITNDFNKITDQNYVYWDNTNKIIMLYDLNNELKFKYEGDFDKYDIDNKYLYIYKETKLKAIYDINKNQLLDNKNILVLYSNDGIKYYIDDDKLLNHDFEEIYTFKDKIYINDVIEIKNNLLYTSNAKNNICVDLSNNELLIEGYEKVISTNKYTAFYKDEEYQIFNGNKKIGTYQNIESFFDNIKHNDNNLLKLIDGDKVKYLIDDKIVSKPEIKIEDKVIDISLCSKGGKIKKNGKVIIDKCLYDISIKGNIIIATDSDTNENVIYINKEKKNQNNFSYKILDEYVVVNDNTTYNTKGKVIGNYDLSIYNDIYVKDSDGSYFLDKNLKVISDKYEKISCSGLNNFCSVEDEKGSKALFYKNKKLTDFIYGNIDILKEVIILDDGINVQALLLDKDSKNYKVPRVINDEIENIDIDKIKRDNKLEFDIPDEFTSLFKKYAYIVENNNRITEYKKYVYNLFKVIIDKSIYKYLNEPYFLSNLRKLNIIVGNTVIENAGGTYSYSENLVTIKYKSPLIIYHELMHFIDYSINDTNEGGKIWICDDELYERENYYKLSKEEKKKCEKITGLIPDSMTEGLTELYTCKYFTNFVSSYDVLVSYITGIEYIVGTDYMNQIFFGSNGNYNFLKLFFDSGYTYNEYKEIIEELKKLEIPSDKNYATEKTIDSLINLYKANIKDKNWQDDKEFTDILKSYIISSVMYHDARLQYKNSEYRKEIEKIFD